MSETNSEYWNYIIKIYNQTKQMTEVWKSFNTLCSDVAGFKKKFHVRPTVKKFNIISTYDELPMNSKSVNKSDLLKVLISLYNDIYLSNIPNQIKCELLVTDYGFSKAGKSESLPQARMISGMAENVELKEWLGEKDLVFLASEFILDNYSTGETRPDIIAYNGNSRIIIFEMKSINNQVDDPQKEATGYIELYGNKKRSETIMILNAYIGIYEKDDYIDFNFEGYGVYGYSSEMNIHDRKRCIKQQAGLIRFKE